MRRTFLIAGLVVSLLGVGTHLVAERLGPGSPRGIVRRYADAAQAGDLGGLRSLALGARIAAEQEVLGQAWLDKVERVIARALVGGARRAQAAHQRFGNALLPEASRVFWDEAHYRDAERGVWMLDRAMSQLTEAEKPFFVVRPREGATTQPLFCDEGALIAPEARAPGGPFRAAQRCVFSTWTELQQLSSRAYNRLPWRERQRTDAATFAARVVAAQAGPELQQQLMLAGATDLDPADQALATTAQLASLQDEAKFRDENGARLLADLYRSTWREGVGAIVVKTPPTGAKLFRSGVASVSAERSGGQLLGGFERVDGGWQLTGVQDLDVRAAARGLCADDDGADDGPPVADGGHAPQGWEPEGDEALGLDERCEWPAVATTALAFSPPSLAPPAGGDPGDEWIAILVALGAGALVLAMVLVTRRRAFEPAPPLEEGEVVLDSIEETGRLARTRATLTTDRVILQQLHWWLATTRTTTVTLARIEAVAVGDGMPAVWVLVGIALLAVFAPGGVLVSAACLVAATTRLTVVAAGRRYGLALAGDGASGAAARFVRRLTRQQQGVAAADEPGAALAVGARPRHRAWLAVAGCLLVAGAQRVLLEGVELEAEGAPGVYLGLAAYAGIVAGGAGVALGALASLAVFAALHPLPLPHTGSAGEPVSWAVFVALVVIGGVAGGLPRLEVGARDASRAATRAIVGVVVIAAALWFVAPLAGAAIAGTAAWGAQVLTAVGGLLAAIGLASPAAPTALRPVAERADAPAFDDTAVATASPRLDDPTVEP